MQSLADTSWKTVQIEPHTDEEKVDILFAFSHGKACCQVKSSINNFQKTDVENWLEELINDMPDASSYELILIGNMSSEMNKFINQLTSGKETNIKNSLVQATLDRISVRLFPFDRDLMENKIWYEVSKFLSSAGLNLKHHSIEIIAMGLVYQFFQFSIIGKVALHLGS